MRIDREAVAEALAALTDGAQTLDLVARWLDVIGESTDVSFDVRTRARTFGAKVRAEATKTKASLARINRGIRH